MADVSAADYNEVAVGISEALTQHRSDRPDAPRAREQLFPSFNRAGLGVALEWERMGQQSVSDALAASASEHGVEFEHVGLTIGSVLHGIDLKRPLSDGQVRFIRDVLLERKVIFFRDQNLSEDEQERFGRYFGELDAFPFGGHGDNPYILEIKHGPQSPGMENGWHTDVTWMVHPSLGSIAQCVTVPPIGGDTL